MWGSERDILLFRAERQIRLDTHVKTARVSIQGNLTKPAVCYSSGRTSLNSQLLSDLPSLCQRIPAHGDHSAMRLETLTSPESKLKSRLLGNDCCAVAEKPTENMVCGSLTLVNFKWVHFIPLNFQLAAWGREQFYLQPDLDGKKTAMSGYQVVKFTAPPNGPNTTCQMSVIIRCVSAWQTN